MAYKFLVLNIARRRLWRRLPILVASVLCITTAHILPCFSHVTETDVRSFFPASDDFTAAPWVPRVPQWDPSSYGRSSASVYEDGAGLFPWLPALHEHELGRLEYAVDPLITPEPDDTADGLEYFQGVEAHTKTSATQEFEHLKTLKSIHLGVVHLILYTVLESFNLATETFSTGYISPYGPVETQASPFSSPAQKKRWLDLRSDLLEVLFRSPFVAVEDAVRNHEYCVIFGMVILVSIWTLYWTWSMDNTFPEFHFDIQQLVPKAVQRRFVDGEKNNGEKHAILFLHLLNLPFNVGMVYLSAFELSLLVLVGDSTSPTDPDNTSLEPRRENEQFSFLLDVLLYCFVVGLVLLLGLYVARPPIVISLLVLLALVITSRLVQAFHLTEPGARDLLRDFTRLEIVQQEEAVAIAQASRARHDFSAQGLKFEAFNRDCQIAGFVSQKKYVKVLLFISTIMFSVSISDNLQRVTANNFREHYSHPQTFAILFQHPRVMYCIELFINAVMFYVSFTVCKISALTILMTSAQTQAATFFVQHCPAIAPYAYPGRSLVDPPYKAIPRWIMFRRRLLNRITEKLSMIQKPADVFYTSLFLLLTTMLLFSSQTQFFVYSEYGWSLTVVGLAGSILFLAAIWEGEAANKAIFHDQETVFWDAWASTTLPSIEEQLLYGAPLDGKKECRQTLSFIGISITECTTSIAAVALCWVWGAIFYQSIRRYEDTLKIRISDY